MLHSAATFLTLPAMLAHALLGCCWHHVHACDRHAPTDAVASVAGSLGEWESCSRSEDAAHPDRGTAGTPHCAGCCRHGRQKSGDDAPDGETCADAGHHFGGCDEARCTFLKSSQVDVPPPAPSRPHGGTAPDAYASLAASLLQQSRCHAAEAGFSGASAALRAHEWVEVWLL